MAILLNTLNLVLCLWAFDRFANTTARVAAMVFAFLGGAVLCFVLALAVAHDYLDGLDHLLSTGVSVLLFWVIALVMLVQRARREQARVPPGRIVLLCFVLIVPVVIALLVANMRFKIGG